MVVNRRIFGTGYAAVRKQTKISKTVFLFIWLIYIIQVHWKNSASQKVKCTSANCFHQHNLSDSHPQKPHWCYHCLQRPCFLSQRAADMSDVWVLKCTYACLLNLSLISQTNQHTVQLSQSIFFRTIIPVDKPKEKNKQTCPVTNWLEKSCAHLCWRLTMCVSVLKVLKSPGTWKYFFPV